MASCNLGDGTGLLRELRGIFGGQAKMFAPYHFIWYRQTREGFDARFFDRYRVIVPGHRTAAPAGSRQTQEVANAMFKANSEMNEQSCRALVHRARVRAPGAVLLEDWVEIDHPGAGYEDMHVTAFADAKGAVYMKVVNPNNFSGYNRRDVAGATIGNMPTRNEARKAPTVGAGGAGVEAVLQAISTLAHDPVPIKEKEVTNLSVVVHDLLQRRSTDDQRDYEISAHAAYTVYRYWQMVKEPGGGRGVPVDAMKYTDATHWAVAK